MKSGRRKTGRTKTPIISSLSEYRPSFGRRCNILLVGLSGSGKSPLINTLLSNNEFVISEAEVRKKSRHGMCTKEIRVYMFNDLDGYNVSVIDTFSALSFTKSSFRAVLKGCVKDGHYVEDPIVEGKQNNKLIVDAVVFVVDTGIFSEKSFTWGDATNKMRSLYDLAKNDFKLPVFIAATRIDMMMKNDLSYKGPKKNILLERDERYAGTLINQSDLWRTCLHNLKTTFDRNAIILPFINYEREDTVLNDVIQFISKKFVQIVTKKIEAHYHRGRVNGIKEEEIEGESDDDVEEEDKPPKRKSPRRKQRRPKNYHSKYYFEDEKAISMNFENKPHGNLKTCIQNEVTPPRFLMHGSYYNLLNLGGRNFRFFLLIVRNNLRNVDDEEEETKIFGLFNPDLDLYFECVTNNPDFTIDFMTHCFGDPRNPLPQKTIQEYCFLSRKGDHAFDSYHERLTQHVKLFFHDDQNHVILTKIEKEIWNRNHTWVLHHIKEKRDREKAEDRMLKRIVSNEREIKKLRDVVEKLRNFVGSLEGSRHQQ